MRISNLCTFVFISIVIASCSTDRSQTSTKPVTKEYVQYYSDDYDDSIRETNTIDWKKLNYCTGIEFTVDDLYYEIIDTLPDHTQERLKILEHFRDEGFSIEYKGHGNWQHGPRMIHYVASKDSCHCDLFKKYYYHEKIDSTYYNLSVSESIICNSRDQ